MKHLVVAPAWVGDMVMAHSFVQLLATVDNQAEIHVLAPAATLALAERMPQVSKAILFPLVHNELALGKRWRVAKSLRQQHYDRAYLLPNSWKSALVPWLARIACRIGWHGEARFGLLNDKRRLEATRRYPLMIERFMALALPAGARLPKPYPLPQLQVDQDNLVALRDRLGLTSCQPVLALCPGAEFGPAKRWPSAHYAQVAAAALTAGQQVWLFGSPKDLACCEEIVAQLVAESANTQALHNLAGRTQLLDALDLLSVADHVVCNDSGLMHIAAALMRPLVALFGSTSPDFTPPLGAASQVLQQVQPCSPCFQRTCPLQHLDCLQLLAPERVITALQIAPEQALSL